MPTQETETFNPEKCPVAMLNEIQRLNVAFQECGDLEFADLANVPDDVLREATNHLFEIRELAGNFYEPIAFQLANNELAEIEVDDPEESACRLDNEAHSSGSTVQATGDVEGKTTAQAQLADAYASMYRRIRNRDRETEADTLYRAELFASFDAAVAGMGDDDKQYFGQLERGHQLRARQIHEQVLGLLKYWGLPMTPSPETYRRPRASAPA